MGLMAQRELRVLNGYPAASKAQLSEDPKSYEF